VMANGFTLRSGNVKVTFGWRSWKKLMRSDIQ
jgi:hypothetical protein